MIFTVIGIIAVVPDAINGLDVGVRTIGDSQVSPRPEKDHVSVSIAVPHDIRFYGYGLTRDLEKGLRRCPVIKGKR